MTEVGIMQRNSVDAPSQLSDLRIVLLGKVGAGKSASGNTIIGGDRDPYKKVFLHGTNTKICQSAHVKLNGQKITVIDTIGLSDILKTDKEKQTKAEQIFDCTDDGIDVFLLVLKLGEKYTPEEENIMKRLWIQEILGSKALKHTIVLFTHVDLLNDPMEECLSQSDILRSIVDQCSGRYHVFNNRSEDQSQVTELLMKIESLRKMNRNTKYTRQIYEETQRNLKICHNREAAEEQERLLKAAEERERLLKEANERERLLKEVEENERLLKEAAEEQKRLLKAAEDREGLLRKEAEEEQERLLKEAAEEREKILKDADERERLFKKAGENEREMLLIESKEKWEKILKDADERERSLNKGAEEERERLLKGAEEERKRLLKEAKEEQEKILKDADERERSLNKRAEEERERLLREAKEEREKILRDADERERSLNKGAEEERERLLKRAEEERKRLLKEAKEEQEKTLKDADERERLLMFGGVTTAATAAALALGFILLKK